MSWIDFWQAEVIWMDDYAHGILDEGQTTISNYLLNNYHKIGINNQEMFIYMLIKGNHDCINAWMADLHERQGIQSSSF